MSIMRQLEDFLDVRVVTFVIMTTHIHVLLEEPDRDKRSKLTKKKLFEKLPFLYDEAQIRTIANELEHAEALGDRERYDLILKRYENRMGHISVFMKAIC